MWAMPTLRIHDPGASDDLQILPLESLYQSNLIMTSSHHDRHTAELHQMQRAIAGLFLYQDILECEIGIALILLLKSIASGDRSQGNSLTCLTAYGRFFKALAHQNCSWEEFLIDRLLQAENPFSLQAQKTSFGELSSAIVNAAQQDLQGLYTLYARGKYIPQWVEQLSSLNGKSISWIESDTLGQKSTIVTALRTRD